MATQLNPITVDSSGVGNTQFHFPGSTSMLTATKDDAGGPTDADDLIIHTQGNSELTLPTSGTLATPIDAWPVGSIFMSVLATSPTTLLGGGTWVRFGVGRVLVSQYDSDTSFDVAEETGGAKTVALAIANLPSHDHTITHTHDLSNHVHTGGVHDHGAGTLVTDTSPTHVHNPGTLATDTVADHQHGPLSTSTTYLCNTGGAISVTASGGTYINRANTGLAGSHNHNVTTGTTTAGGAHSHNITGLSGGAGSVNTTGASPNITGASSAANTGMTGSGTAVDKLPPYIVVYMWKRTA